MNFTIIDMDTFPRKEHYLHYKNKVNCTYSVTANLDVTALVSNIKLQHIKVKLYPTLIYIVTKAVNSIREFKMAVIDEKLGYYNKVSPSYLVFHDDDKTFSCAYTDFQEDFTAFYNNLESDINRYQSIHGYIAIPAPQNCFPVSCLPWLSYTALNLNVPYEHNFYAPIITWGKHFPDKEQTLLPMTVQANHAVADGYHVSQLFAEMQNCINELANI